MENRVLEIVFYLIDYLQDEPGQPANLGEISTDLKGLGYSEEEIKSAYTWLLGHMQSSGENLFSKFPDKSESVRIMTPSERMHFEPEAFNTFIRLRAVGIIDAAQFEEILDRICLIGQRPVGLEQFKLLVSMIVFGDKAGHEFDIMLDDSSDDINDIN